jgi:hypothetical protein
MSAAARILGSVRQPPRLRLRHLWFVPGLAIAFTASAIAERHGVGLAPLLIFGILPHASVLLGFGQPRARGQLASRAIPVFNALHQPLLPLSVGGLAFTGLLAPVALASALAWLSHIVIDWGLGDGLRTREGFRPARVSASVGGPA